MRLLSPWALVGLVAIAGPIAAHLLARRPPKTLRFPNLRFLPPTVPTPVKRHRLADHGLLVLRMAIIAVAAFALAQPTISGPSGPSGSSGPAGAPGPSGSDGPPRPTGPASLAAATASRDLTLLTSASERAGADAAFMAAVQQGAPKQLAGDRDIAIVFPGFEQRESLLKDATPLSQPWMSDLFTSIATDPLVQAAAGRLNRAPLSLLSVTGDRTAPGRLLVFVDAPAHSLFATATISAILRSVPFGSSSVDSAPVPSDSPSVTSAPEESSLARWVWLVVGGLLLAETAIRRHRPITEQKEDHARVA